MAKVENNVADGSSKVSTKIVASGDGSEGDAASNGAASVDSRSPALKKRKRAPPKQLKVGHMPKRLPLYYPKKPRTLKRPMIVQVDDDNLDLSADSGAIGRVHVDKEKVQLDLKGQRYFGKLFPGPTLMVLGLSAEKATVESLCNDFCQAEHARDVIGSFGGQVLQGSVDTSEVFQGDLDVNSAAAARREAMLLRRGQAMLDKTMSGGKKRNTKKAKRKNKGGKKK